MNNLQIYTLNDFTRAVLLWIENQLAGKNFLVELLAIIGCFAGSYLLARILASSLNKKHQFMPARSVLRLNMTTQALITLALANLSLLITISLFNELQLTVYLLRASASLFFAWTVIRVGAGTINSLLISRWVAAFLFFIALLNAFDLLKPLSQALEQEGIKIGSVNVTLLLVFKSIIAFGILLWGTYFVSNVMERLFKRSKSFTPSQQVLFYKITNLALYAITFALGLNIVGIDLAALAVFSGALGLGIGFGLQKVFSNLISGIILLLDKSVKPGDVIAVGDTFGWVNTLGARYVSVLTREGKEHLIPNENLISQEVENWSYSNSQVRIKIPLGVSYNADLDLVKKLLLQSCEGHPRILETPAPACFLTGFGDSSVDHELSVWISDPAQGISNLRSDIYYKIWALFKEHGVEIPFPQRDIHLKMDKPTEQQLSTLQKEI